MSETIRQPGDRLTGQPQERQHSDAEGGTRNRLPPAKGAAFLACGIGWTVPFVVINKTVGGAVSHRVRSR
jgi:hypothetical protein